MALTHSKKMILVPEETLSRFNSNSGSHDVISGELGKILKSNLDDYEKWQLIKQASSKFLDLSKIGPAKLLIEEEKGEKREENAKEEVKAEVKAETKPPIQLFNVPRHLKGKVNGLLQFLESLPNISWDNGGQVTLDGRLLSGSNLLDLILDVACSQYKLAPRYSNEFVQFLSDSNAPKHLIANEKYREILFDEPLAVPLQMNNKRIIGVEEEVETPTVRKSQRLEEKVYKGKQKGEGKKEKELMFRHWTQVP